MMKRSRIMFLLVLIAVAGKAQDPNVNNEVDVIHVNGSIYTFRSNTKIANPNTTVSIGKDGVFMVDPGFVDVGPSIERNIKKIADSLGVPSQAKYVVTTHYHGDHSEGLEYFGPASTVITPVEQRAHFATIGITTEDDFLEEPGWPDITFNERMNFYFNDEVIEVYTPTNKNGHTGGDAIVHFSKSGVVAVGDYFFVDMFPLVDLDAGGDLDGYLGNIQSIIDTYSEDTYIVPGHPHFRPVPIQNYRVSKLKENYTEVRETIEIIKNKMSAGMDLEELTAEGLPPRYNKYDERPRYASTKRWISFVYNYYSAESNPLLT